MSRLKSPTYARTVCGLSAQDELLDRRGVAVVAAPLLEVAQGVESDQQDVRAPGIELEPAREPVGVVGLLVERFEDPE